MQKVQVKLASLSRFYREGAKIKTLSGRMPVLPMGPGPGLRCLPVLLLRGGRESKILKEMIGHWGVIIIRGSN